jgi:hypothetical protein
LTPLLCEFFAKDASDEFRDFFQILGVLNDNHLQIILGIEREEIKEFLRSYVPNQLSHFGLAALTRRLDKFVAEHPWAPRSFTLIPRKGSSFEVFLRKHTTSLNQVAHSMRFTADEYNFLAVR